MKIAILGGGGFLGTHLSAELLARGHTVRVFDRPPLARLRRLPHYSEVEWIEGDFVNPNDVAGAIAGCEAVFHLVSTTVPQPSNLNPAYDVETNLVGSLRLLELATQAQLKKLVFVSSGGTVYGVPQHIPVAETHPTEPTCSYGIAKLAIEKYLHLWRLLHGLEYCVLRVANAYGEWQRPVGSQGAVAAFVERALKRQTIEIWGDGSVVRDYVYAGDIARALAIALDCRTEDRVFNIGSGIGRSLNDIIGAIESAIGSPVARNYTAARRFDVPVNVLDISRARAQLGWVPEITFVEGVRRTLLWQREYL